MICKKLVDKDDGGLWYLFYDRDSDEQPRMVMSERQALIFMEDMTKELEEREAEDGLHDA
jgi:hypothetical protein|tara:strand:+ start:519 stop:698 length:180 start_codon:yes stop_codon:yes gene_type:complete